MKRTEKQQGAVLVEMAFIVPILALIILMVVDVGLMAREYQLLQNAAREGAHYSALRQNWNSPLNDPDDYADGVILARIRQVVVAYCAAENITIRAADVSVDQNHNIALGGGLTAKGSLVTVTYSRRMLLLGRPLLPAGSMTLRARSVFRNLY